MNLFVNDIPVTIFKPGMKPEAGLFNHTLDARKTQITKASLINHVLVIHAGIEHLEQILDLINSKVPINLLALAISLEEYGLVKPFLAKKFRIVKAAGGLVRKKERFLMIFRQKKWDLPKGKKEEGERYRETAVREVEEECSIQVRAAAKICTTWHTYTMNKKAMLKKTRWYGMDIVDDSGMRPRQEEDIEEVRWMNRKEVYHALENSYRSIRFVFERYYSAMEEVK